MRYGTMTTTVAQDLLDVVAMQQQRKFGAQAEAPAHAERGERVGVFGDARVQERAYLLRPERVGRAQAGARSLREVVGFLKFLRESVVAGVAAVAEGVPHRRFHGERPEPSAS